MEKDTISGMLALAQATALTLVFVITDKIRKKFKHNGLTYYFFILFNNWIFCNKRKAWCRRISICLKFRSG
jgi:hypothetical protein